jgi:TATA-binding protein-associated factor Taf7
MPYPTSNGRLYDTPQTMNMSTINVNEVDYAKAYLNEDALDGDDDEELRALDEIGGEEAIGENGDAKEEEDGEEGDEEDGDQENGDGDEDGGGEEDELDNEEPLYVNAKQYHRILKRRLARARLEELNRLSRSRKVSISSAALPYVPSNWQLTF